MCKTVSINHYIKTIYQIQKENGLVRNINIAAALNYSKPSVTRAVAALEEMGYVKVHDHIIQLTPEGTREAVSLMEKYETICDFLLSLGVSVQAAPHDACELEHGISEETYEKMKSGQ